MSSCSEVIPSYDVFVCPSIHILQASCNSLIEELKEAGSKEIKQCPGCGATNYTIKQNKKVCEYCGNDQ